jgi:hypothetical protein
VLSFDRKKTTEQDLTMVRDIVRESPGTRRVQLSFCDEAGNLLKMEAGREFGVTMTPDTEKKLERWLDK